MSRNTSPAPQALSIPPPPASHSSRSKSKNIPMGITAGAEDVKYQAKYKELKRKVQEIEQDNDRLHFKVLQAKRNIQRMKVERAILYDRLASFPPSPELNDHQSLPPMNPVPQISSSAITHSGHPDPNYARTRVSTAPDGRPVPVADPAIGPGVVPSLPLHNSRQSSSGSDTRQLPPLALPPMQALEGPPSPLSRPHHDSPSMHHERTSSRSHSSSRSRVHQQPPPAHHYPPTHPQPYENLPPMHHSPSFSERERRRHDIHDMEPSRAPPPLSPTQEPSRSSSSNRDRHNHQRLGPGTYINREDQAVRDREQRDYERVREWELERERETAYRDANSRSTATHQQQHHGHHSDSPPAVHRSLRQQPPPPPPPHHSRMRDEQGYYLDIPPGGGKVARSDTPGSGGSGHGPSPDSPRGAGSQYPPYELDRQRPFKLQPVGDSMDYVHPEDRSPSQSRTDRNGGGGSGSMYTPSDNGSRKEKRARGNETGATMDVDNGVYPPEDSPTGSGSSSYPHHQDRDRGLKRYQPRGSDSLEDVRMGL